MTALATLWETLHGTYFATPTATLSPDAPEWMRPRSALLVWLQNLETLARSLGYPTPSPAADTLRPAGEHFTRVDESPVAQWAHQWETITHNSRTNLPPEDLFSPPNPDPLSALTWSQLAHDARADHAPNAVVTYLEARSQAALPADSPLAAIDRAHRVWWDRRLAQPFAVGPLPPSPRTGIDPSQPVHVSIGPGTMTVTPTRPTSSPTSSPTTRNPSAPSVHNTQAGDALAGLAIGLGGVLMATRRRRGH